MTGRLHRRLSAAKPIDTEANRRPMMGFAALYPAYVAYEEQYKMAYVTSFERIGMEKGRREGRREHGTATILRLMQRKFGDVPGEAKARIEQADAETLLDWSERILTAEKPEDVFDQSAQRG